MRIVVLFHEPVEDVDSLLPVDLKTVCRFVVDVFLQSPPSSQPLLRHRVSENTYLDRHLINMNSFLNSEFRNHHIESRVENSNDGSGSNDGTISTSEVGDENAEEEMGGLFLSEFSGVFLDVAILRYLVDRFRIHREFEIGSYSSPSSAL